MKKLLPCLLFLIPGPVLLAGELQVHFTDADGNPVTDAVIEIIAPQIPVPEGWVYTGLMDQVDKEFIDNVVTVVAGSYISFPNSDHIQHHVYSFSGENSFELPLYSDDEADPILFDAPGVAVVGCNIHDWMLGYIYVGESHLMATSNDYGIAAIAGLDAGEHTFKIWHERARRGDQFSEFSASVPATGATTINVQLDLGRDRRIRRAPAGPGSDYD